jgi:hypothetical protein
VEDGLLVVDVVNTFGIGWRPDVKLDSLDFPAERQKTSATNVAWSGQAAAG